MWHKIFNICLKSFSVFLFVNSGMKDCLWKISLGCIIASLICFLVYFLKVVVHFIKEASLDRMTFYPFLLLPLLLVLNLLSTPCSGQSLLEEEEPPENYKFQIFLEEEEALAKVFAGCNKIESEFLSLTPEGQEYFKELLKRPDIETTFQVYIGKKGNVIDRYAIITEERGCFHPITWILSTSAEGRILDIADKAFNEMERIERLFKNELKSLNSKAGKALYSCNNEVFEVMKRCYQYGVLTEGAFDITISPLLERWGVYKGKLNAVSDEKLIPILNAVSYKNIKIDDDNKTISFAHRQTKVDLGPVVKGYAVDKALELVKESGITSVCINYGSVTRMLEPPSGKNSWKIGIPHPVKGDAVIGSLYLNKRGVAFVANYARYPSVQGKTYNHLVDPKLGKPVTGGILAVTAIGATAEEAGALATSLFVTGIDGIQRLPKIFPDMGWVLLYEKSENTIELLVSPNMSEIFMKGEEKIFKYGKGSGCPFSP